MSVCVSKKEKSVSEDSGEATVTVVPYRPEKGDPHMVALQHAAELFDDGGYEVVAVLMGRCHALVTQQSLRIYAERLLASHEH